MTTFYTYPEPTSDRLDEVLRPGGPVRRSRAAQGLRAGLMEARGQRGLQRLGSPSSSSNQKVNTHCEEAEAVHEGHPQQHHPIDTLGYTGRYSIVRAVITDGC